MNTYHFRSSTRRLSTVAGIFAAALGALCGWRLIDFNQGCGLGVISGALLWGVWCALALNREITAELKITGDLIAFRFAKDLHSIERRQVLKVQCYDQLDFTRMLVVTKDGREIGIPGGCFRERQMAMSYLRQNWPEVLVECALSGPCGFVSTRLVMGGGEDGQG